MFFKAFSMLFAFLSTVCFHSLIAREFTDKKGEVIELQWVKEGDLKDEEIVFVDSFSKSYKKFSEADLNVKNKMEFLVDAFTDLKKDFEEKKCTILRALHQGKSIGLTAFKTTEKPGQVYIAQLALMPSYWRRGIAREMVFSSLEKYPDTTHLVAIGRRINLIGAGFFKGIGFIETSYIYPGYDPAYYVGYELHIGK